MAQVVTLFQPRAAVLRWLLCLCVSWLGEVTAQPVPCHSNAFLVLSNELNNSSRLYQLNIDEEQFSVATVGTANLPRLAALGHSTLDNYLYALGADDYHLYRIGLSGQAQDLGIPQGLDTNYTFHAGAIHPDGTRFVLPGRGKVSGRDEEIFSIRLNTPNFLTGNTTVVSVSPLQISDIAWDPLLGTLYGFDELNRRLVNLGWPGGLVTSHNTNPQTGLQKLGSLFFNDAGQLYGFGGSSAFGLENTLFLFDKYTGQILETRPGPAGSFSDACSCPYRVSLEREFSSERALPCQEFDITYRWRSSAGAIYGFRVLADSLPDGFIISEVLEFSAPGTVLSGPGTNILRFSIDALIFREDSLRIRVQAPEMPGVYLTQATLGDFPTGLSVRVPSSDALAPLPGKPNKLRVLANGDLFEEEQQVLCPDQPLRLVAPKAQSYTWSTGSNDPFIEITTPGELWLELEGPCGVYRDTLNITLQAQPLRVSLGPDRKAVLGQQLTLPYSHNADSIVAYHWTSQPEGLLLCTVCPKPLLGPLLEDTNVTLKITDQDGCTSRDSLKIQVLKERQIYAANVFSPNNDGVNDVFFLQGHPGTRVRQLRIYNRWGQLIFQAPPGDINDPQIGWDGRTATLQSAPTGVYVWQAELEYADGIRTAIQGDVSLLR
jgi:gliding motility-associated-like protein